MAARCTEEEGEGGGGEHTSWDDCRQSDLCRGIGSRRKRLGRSAGAHVVHDGETGFTGCKSAPAFEGCVVGTQDHRESAVVSYVRTVSSPPPDRAEQVHCIGYAVCTRIVYRPILLTVPPCKVPSAPHFDMIALAAVLT